MTTETAPAPLAALLADPTRVPLRLPPAAARRKAALMSDPDATRIDADELRRTVAAVLDVDPADLTDDARFVEDLGGTSLLAFEVLVELERKYGVEFTREEMALLTSMPSTRAVLAAKLGGRP